MIHLLQKIHPLQISISQNPSVAFREEGEWIMSHIGQPHGNITVVQRNTPSLRSACWQGWCARSSGSEIVSHALPIE
jgi:hypothetical protein